MRRIALFHAGHGSPSLGRVLLGRAVSGPVRFGAGLLMAAFLLPACGYSQAEWDQKLREIENLNNRLSAQQRERAKLEQDFADASAEIDRLKKRLKESGVNLESLNADLLEQKRALEEYRARAKQLEAIRQRFELLREKLKKLTSLGLKVSVRDNRMVIALPGDVLFASGQAKLTKEGGEILSKVAAVIRDDADLNKREFQVAGHTDAKPLKGGPFKDNWGLSAMRARSVLVYLTEPVEEGGGGLDRSNWSAAGYADTDPIADNDTEEGRQKNRRVELVVIPDVKEMLDLKSLLK